MSRFIIVAEREDRVILPIIHGDDDSTMEGCMCVYDTREEAEAAADEVMACRAFGYTLIDLDDLTAERAKFDVWWETVHLEYDASVPDHAWNAWQASAARSSAPATPVPAVGASVQPVPASLTNESIEALRQVGFSVFESQDARDAVEWLCAMLRIKFEQTAPTAPASAPTQGEANAR